MAKYRLLLEGGGAVEVDFDEVGLWETLTTLDGVGGEIFLSGRRVISVETLSTYLNTRAQDIATQTVNDLVVSFPEAIRPVKRGVWAAGVTYNEDDLVQYTLPDGRIGSYICRAVSTTQVPTNTDDWQIYALPNLASGGGAVVAPTTIKLSEQAGSTYNIDLSAGGRLIIVKDAAKTIGFTGLASRGYAQVFFANPASGTSFPVTFSPEPTWEDAFRPATETLGRGDAVVFNSWSGTSVSAVVTQQSVFYAAENVGAVTGTLAMWRFREGATSYQNVLVPGTNDFTASTGTQRPIIGTNYAATQRADTNAITGLNFNSAFTLGFVMEGMYGNAPAFGATPPQKVAWGISSPTSVAQYAHISLRSVAAGTPALAFIVRDNPTGAANPFNFPVGSTSDGTANGAPLVYLLLPNQPLHYIMVEYDGAGRWQLYDVHSGNTLFDSVANAAASGNQLYPGGNAANIQTYTSMWVNIGGIKRSTTSVIDGNGGHLFRPGFLMPRVMTLAERREQYNYARDFIASVDPTGPNLPVLP